MGNINRAVEYFIEFLKKKKLRLTKQREIVVRVFLEREGHLGIDELYSIIHKKHPNIGYVTVWRTLNLLKKAKIAAEVNFGDRKTKYEHLFDHEHHDHLICLCCGESIEVIDPRIERLQEKLAKRHRFKVQRHRMEIFGLCRCCQRDRK